MPSLPLVANTLLPFTEGTQTGQDAVPKRFSCPVWVWKKFVVTILLTQLYEVYLIDTENSQWEREGMCEVDVIKQVLLDSNENCRQLSSCLKQLGYERVRN